MTRRWQKRRWRGMWWRRMAGGAAGRAAGAAERGGGEARRWTCSREWRGGGGAGGGGRSGRGAERGGGSWRAGSLGGDQQRGCGRRQRWQPAAAGGIWRRCAFDPLGRVEFLWEGLWSRVGRGWCDVGRVFGSNSCQSCTGDCIFHTCFESY